MIKRDICFGLLLLLLAAGASAFDLKCSDSWTANGMIRFRLLPKPDPHCVLYWSTAEGKQIASGNKIDDDLVEASSHDKIILKKCIPKLECSVDCDHSDGHQNFKASCSADCSVSEPTSATTQNKDNSGVDTGSQKTSGALPLSACIPLVCLVVVIVVVL